jgi:uncharacterized cupredoxin-like copper-binding protein
MRRIAPVLLGGVILLLAAACGSSDGGAGAAGTTATVTTSSGSGTGSGSGSGGRLQIAEQEWSLDPSSPTVAAAGEVTIHVVNDGSFGHALEIDGNGVEEETATLSAGDSADLTVTLKPGTYEIYCPIGNHREQGMEGTLTVAGGGSGGTTTSEDTTTGEDTGGGYGYGG